MVLLIISSNYIQKKYAFNCLFTHLISKRFKYIKRLLRKYHDTKILKERLILNHLTVLHNVFGSTACTTLLIFKISKGLEDYSSLSELLEELPSIKEILTDIVTVRDKVDDWKEELIGQSHDYQVNFILRKLLNLSKNMLPVCY